MSTSGKSGGLGRGLSALLGEQAAPNTATDKSKNPIRLPIDLLQRNPEQPRRHFAEKAMQQLVNSIRQQGVLQPILVRPIVGTSQYQIVAGERRWRAAGQAGLHEIPVYVRELSDREVMEVALVENMQRADLNPVEEAQGYRALIQQFHHTQEEVAKAVARSRSHVANMVRLLDLPEALQGLLVDGKITAGHARALLSCDHPEELAQKVVALGLNVRQTEKIAQSGIKAPETKNQKQQRAVQKDPDIRALEAQLGQNLGLQVDIQQKGAQKGILQIEYQTLEQLDDLCRRINNN